MTNFSVELYRQMFVSLKRGNHRGIVSNAKPIYLVTLLEIIPSLKKNLIEINNPILNECFTTNVRLIQGEKKTQLSMPYFHLSAEPFYEILWKEGVVPIMKSHSPSAQFLSKHILGAKLDDELWELLQDEENRQYLRECIIKHYFTD